MAGYSDEQIRDAFRHAEVGKLNVLKMQLELARSQISIERIRAIAADHITCECSAALMILEVLDRG